jgi:hypothetical protein
MGGISKKGKMTKLTKREKQNKIAYSYMTNRQYSGVQKIKQFFPKMRILKFINPYGLFYFTTDGKPIFKKGNNYARLLKGIQNKRIERFI